MFSACKEFKACNKVHVLYTLWPNDAAQYSHCIVLVMYKYEALQGSMILARETEVLEKTYPSATTMFIKTCFWILNAIN